MSPTVEIQATVIAETDLAWLLDDGDIQVWVPKSQVEDCGDGVFEMPEWLATDKGFI